MPIRTDHEVAIIIREFIQNRKNMPGTKNYQILLIGLFLGNHAKKTPFYSLGIINITYAPGSPESIHKN